MSLTDEIEAFRRRRRPYRAGMAGNSSFYGWFCLRNDGRPTRQMTTNSEADARAEADRLNIVKRRHPGRNVTPDE